MRSVDSTARRVSLAVLTIFILVAFSATNIHAQTATPSGDVQADGTLEVQYQDYEGGARLRHFLRTADRLYELKFPGNPPDISAGSHVRVHGAIQNNNTLLLSSDGPSVQVVALASPYTFGAQKTLVILVNFADKVTQPYSVSTADSITFGQANNYYLENTYQQTSLNGTVVGWFTINMSSTTCDESGSTVATLAKQAAVDAGVDLSQYAHFVYAFPQNACTWWGMGTVGGTPGQVWINGSYALRVVAHELGHNFGDYHSHSQPCDSSTCTTVEYGDDRDVMGKTGVVGHMNAFQKERLGWLNYGASPPIQTVGTPGNYWIEAMETAPSGAPKAIKILKATDAYGRRTWYYAEARARLGVDGNIAPGVVVHTGSEASGNTSYQLDMQPTTTTWDSTLDVAQGFSDPAIGLTLTALTSDSTGALVQVAFGTVPCAKVTPTVSLSPSGTLWVRSGATATYTVSLMNNDTSSCSGAPFSLNAVVPTGWSATLTPALFSSVLPGTSQNASLVISIPSTASSTQSVMVTGSETTGALGSASVTMIAAPSLIVTAASDKSSYNGGTITVSSSVAGNQSPVPGATVVFTFTSGSKTISQSATTNASGVAVTSYRLKAKDPKGTWQVTASATKDAVTGNGSASFTVQ